MDLNKSQNEMASTDSGKQQSPIDRDKVKSERETRRLAKQQSKQKFQDKSRNLPKPSMKEDKSAASDGIVESNLQQVASTALDKCERSKKQQQQPHSSEVVKETVTSNKNATEIITAKVNKLSVTHEAEKSNEQQRSADKIEKKQLTKAERRAIQEAQRTAKATKNFPQPSKSVAKKESSSINAKKASTNENSVPLIPSKKLESSNAKIVGKKSIQHRVKLFNHLYTDSVPCDLLNSNTIHPAIIQLGVQYSSGIVKGCNARGLAFMNAIKSVIDDYETPSQKEFSRSLEDAIKSCVNYLQKCRPLAVSMTNAMKYIQWQLRQLPKLMIESDGEQKAILLEQLDTYVRDQMDKAAEAISITVQQKISDGDVILTFGCSSVILNILNEAKKSTRDFRVIVVDARPWHEGKEMLRRLVAKHINCTCVLINAVGFIMPEVTKVLLGAHALLANGYVMSRAGTAQIAMIAKSYNVPVLVCCETHKFSERVQTDAFVYNEIGNPYDLVTIKEKNDSPLNNWESIAHLTPLNLYYDVTPPELVSAVVTEVAILPCTSVPVILRIKPSDIGY